MKVVAINQLKKGMFLAQNIYRHDSLLAIPKGTMIDQLEVQAIKYYNLDYVLVIEENRKIKRQEDLRFTLEIIESAYKNTTLWEKEFGEELYEELEKRIIKNRMIQKYLIQLRKFDTYSFAHCINISIVIASILRKEKRPDKKFIHIVLLALLHDVGRLTMKDVFNKQGKLNDKEYLQLIQHPQKSFEMLKKAGFLDFELKFVQETHEKWDGTGYPFKLKEREIEDLAQLIHIADVYNGLSSYRPYRGEVFSPYEVMRFIQEDMGKRFGEVFVNVFLDRFSPYSVGSKVELSDGNIAVVSRIHKGRKTLPIVDIISENSGERIKTIDLGFRKDLRIRKILQSY